MCVHDYMHVHQSETHSNRDRLRDRERERKRDGVVELSGFMNVDKLSVHVGVGVETP